MSSFAPASISTSQGKTVNESEPPPESELMESEVEDEVDQLESDTDAEAPAQQKAPAILRPPGKTLLPANRIDNIIQADGVTGTLALSKEGQFLVSIATEAFIKRMVEAGLMKAKSERRSTVNYNDMAYTTQQYQEFMFLEDTIPAPIPLAEALQLRREKEQEILDDNPAMATAPPATNPYPSFAPTPAANQSGSTKAKSTKTKTSQPSGNEKNGSASTTQKREKKQDHGEKSSSKRKEKDSTKERSKSSATPATNGVGSASVTSPAGNKPPTSSSKTSVSTTSNTQAVAIPTKTEMDVDEPTVATSRPDGSVSGVVQGSSASFEEENPGRTIYSDS